MGLFQIKRAKRDVKTQCNLWETRLDHALKRRKVMNDLFRTTGENCRLDIRWYYRTVLNFLGVNYYIWCLYRRVFFFLADVYKGKQSWYLLVKGFIVFIFQLLCMIKCFIMQNLKTILNFKTVLNVIFHILPYVSALFWILFCLIYLSICSLPY